MLGFGHNRTPPPGSATSAESVAHATYPLNLIRLVPAKEAGRPSNVDAVPGIEPPAAAFSNGLPGGSEIT